MSSTSESLVSATRNRWVRRLFYAAGAIALLVLAVWVAVPPIARAQLETRLTETLGRTTTVESVSFDLNGLRLVVRNLVIADKTGQRPLFALDELVADVSAASLWQRAPVFDAVKLTRPRLLLARASDGRYNVHDLVDRVLAPRPPGPPPQFSFNNIEIDGGTVSLDDRRLRRKVALANLAIGIPFLSSLPHDAEIRVNPNFEGTLDGARFTLKGSTSSPFGDRKEAAVDIEFDALPLAGYVQYVPLPQSLKLADGALTTRLKLAFVSEKGEPRTAILSGTARVDRLAIARSDGSPLIGARSINVTLGKLDPLARAVALAKVAIEAPDVDVRRGADGIFEFGRLWAPDAGAVGSASTAPVATNAVPLPIPVAICVTSILANRASPRTSAALPSARSRSNVPRPRRGPPSRPSNVMDVSYLLLRNALPMR